ncbi:MAG: hypothetical protein ABI584_11605 [Acidobacteriota bacterium]
MKRLISALAGGLLLTTAFAASAAANRSPSSTSPPITSWQAPAYYTPGPSGRTALTDANAPMPYIPLVPCRQYDSRSTSALPDNTSRTVTLSGAPCGVPTTVGAVAVNITVFNIVGAGSNGVFKVGTSSPPTTAWINYPSTETQRANAGVLTTTGPANIVVQVNQGAGSVDFVVDVFGYYGPTPANASNYFSLNTNSSGYTMFLTNASTTCGGACGIYQFVGSGHAIYGTTNSTLATDASIYGTSGAALGMYGLSTTNIGVKGQTAATSGDLAGVTGYDGTGVTYTGSLNGTAGVYGWGRSGVAGATSSTGSWGVIGMKLTNPSTLGPFGVLGYSTYGVFSFGNTGATGVKSFVEPHPTDAAKVIKYVSLEGPEAGTYFRGSGQIVSGVAVIDVPDNFRWVSDESGLTVHITPVGGPGQVWVESRGLDRVVVRSNRDVSFDYIVHGVRKAFKDFQPVVDGADFVPRSPDATIPAYLSEEAKARLIANGTYNLDGTVNMGTAERMGWAQAWREEAAAAAAHK